VKRDREIERARPWPNGARIGRKIFSNTANGVLDARETLERVPEKLTDFSDQNMLQEIDFEGILIDRMIPSDRNTL
jgi:hypothetical protein